MPLTHKTLGLYHKINKKEEKEEERGREKWGEQEEEENRDFQSWVYWHKPVIPATQAEVEEEGWGMGASGRALAQHV